MRTLVYRECERRSHLVGLGMFAALAVVVDAVDSDNDISHFAAVRALVDRPRHRQGNPHITGCELELLFDRDVFGRVILFSVGSIAFQFRIRDGEPYVELSQRIGSVQRQGGKGVAFTQSQNAARSRSFDPYPVTIAMPDFRRYRCAG